MKIFTKKFLSIILTLSMLFSSMVPVFAAENYINVQTSINTQEEIDAARQAYAALTPEAKAIFDDSLVYDRNMLEFHITYVDPNFKLPTPKRQPRSAAASDPMRVLTLQLGRLGLPQAVVYSLKAMGAGMIAAIADGPLPVGDILLAAATASAVVVIATHWDAVAPKFDQIIRAFQNAFSSAASNVSTAFAKIKGDAKKKSDKDKADKAKKEKDKKDSKEVEAIKRRIPSKLMDKNGNIDLSKFKTRVSKNGRVGLQEDVTGQKWVIEKDRGLNTGRGSHQSAWKLKTQRQYLDKRSDVRTATLSENGKILRG